jgi:hypothetical protein
MTYFSPLFTLALYLQQSLGKSALYSGLALVSWVAAFGIGGPVYPHLPARITPLVAPAGFLILAASYFAIGANLFGGHRRRGAMNREAAPPCSHLIAAIEQGTRCRPRGICRHRCPAPTTHGRRCSPPCMIWSRRGSRPGTNGGWIKLNCVAPAVRRGYSMARVCGITKDEKNSVMHP